MMPAINNHQPFTTMTTKSLVFIACLAAVLLPLPLANACSSGFYDFGEDYRVAFLNPYLAGDGYSAFFYSSEYLNHYGNDTNGSDRRRNCEEWAARVGNGTTHTDVAEFLYGTSLDNVLNAIAEGTESKRFGGNLFLQTLLKTENKAVLDYLVFAKKYEHLSSEELADPWRNSWDQPEQDVEIEKQQLKTEGESAMNNTNDPWLQRRYAYQLMLMNRYANDRAGFDALYDTYFKNDRSTVLSDWALHHKAAMVSDPAYSAYLYGMSFDRCPEKNVSAYQNFAKKHFDTAFAFAQNDHERAALLALLEIKNPGHSLDNIQKITELDPANRFLPLLFVREVNKLEDWLLTNELTNGGPAVYPGVSEEMYWEWESGQWDDFRRINRQKDLLYLSEVRGYFQQTIGKKGLDADLLNLLTAHLLSMEHDPSAANHLNAISENCRQSIKEQRATEELLLLLNQADISKPDVQAKMADLLVSLQAIYKNQPKGGRDFEALNLLLKEAFMKKGNLLYAYCFNNHALHMPSKDNSLSSEYYALLNFLDWKATEKDIDDVIALLDKPDKTAFEEYLTSAYFPSRNALLDLRGTISFRKNDLPEALSAFSKVEKDFWKTKYEFANCLVSDPFVVWQDSTHRGHFPDTKTAFVQRLLNLETEAKSNPDKAAENYLQIGTAWLNCMQQGKSWMMFCYGWSIGDGPDMVDYNTYLPHSTVMNEVYFEGKRALEYLTKAKAAAPDNGELAARADFLIARLHSQHYDLTPAEQAEIDSLSWPDRPKFYQRKELSYFEDWAAQYKQTETWDEITGMCPVIKDYFGK